MEIYRRTDRSIGVFNELCVANGPDSSPVTESSCSGADTDLSSERVVIV